jgi:hypothetical protein
MQNFIDNAYHNFERNPTPHSKLVNIFEIDLSKWTQLEHVHTFLHYSSHF